MNPRSLAGRGRAMLLAALLLLGCSRPLDRPLEGAPARPGSVSDLGLADPPATVVVPGPSPAAPQAAVLAPSPSPTPAVAGHNPILSGLVPAPDAQVPTG